MLIIIDGYNVLKQSQANDINENQRSAFINKIAKYSKKKGHKAIIIFDGGPFGWPTKEKIRGISIIYSGYKQTADESIKQFIIEHRNKNLLLVSSDRELNQWADAAEVVSIDSYHFLLLLKQALQKPPAHTIKKNNVVKTSETQNHELDQLMLEASQQIEVKKEDLVDIPIDQAEEKVSKKEKKQLKKIRKL